MAAMLNLKESI